MQSQPELQVSSLSKVRGSDCQGSGWFHAPRGKHRRHNGIDLVCDGGTLIRACNSGTVTKADGCIYADPKKRDWRYIEITDGFGNKVRYFYVVPVDLPDCKRVELGLRINRGDVIGVAQGIESLYEGITPHIHFEVKNSHNNIINPSQYLLDVDARNNREAK